MTIGEDRNKDRFETRSFVVFESSRFEIDEACAIMLLLYQFVFKKKEQVF